MVKDFLSKSDTQENYLLEEVINILSISLSKEDLS
jgi:hypothetical protein